MVTAPSPDEPAAGSAPAFAGGVAAALAGRCPWCGRGRLFARGLTPAERCDACGADFRAVDAGDGPAVFVILVVGGLVTAAALITEVHWSPPYWLHAVLWVPMIVLLSLGLLRPLKAVLIARQLRLRAGEAGAVHPTGWEP